MYCGDKPPDFFERGHAIAKHAVTGAFGYSGKYLAKRLLYAGEEVITLTNSPNRPKPI
ncbi:MAG: NAD-dependent epimerase/dehydratase family protein [Deferribacteraceae bacterium]|nr:NAD-dependent epimerase/dehydratase family protein [Deferribacteraceae bacterium]